MTAFHYISMSVNRTLLHWDRPSMTEVCAEIPGGKFPFTAWLNISLRSLRLSDVSSHQATSTYRTRCWSPAALNTNVSQEELKEQRCHLWLCSVWPGRHLTGVNGDILWVLREWVKSEVFRHGICGVEKEHRHTWGTKLRALCGGHFILNIQSWFDGKLALGSLVNNFKQACLQVPRPY